MTEQHMDEEQMRALQEKIKSMSPEELKEFQKKQCIFCQIVSGKVPSKKVYEDNDVLAILDINPASLGHILLMPREHYSILPQIPDELIRHIFVVAKTLSNAMLRGLEAQGANIIVANGVAAGQKAQHFMVHLISRKDDDNLVFDIPQSGHSEKELLETATKIAAGFGRTITGGANGGQPPQEKEEQPVPKETEILPAREKSAVQKNQEPKPKKQAAARTKPAEKEVPEKKDTSKIDLDDIARMLGVK